MNSKWYAQSDTRRGIPKIGSTSKTTSRFQTQILRLLLVVSAIVCGKETFNNCKTNAFCQTVHVESFEGEPYGSKICCLNIARTTKSICMDHCHVCREERGSCAKDSIKKRGKP